MTPRQTSLVAALFSCAALCAAVRPALAGTGDQFQADMILFQEKRNLYMNTGADLQDRRKALDNLLAIAARMDEFRKANPNSGDDLSSTGSFISDLREAQRRVNANPDDKLKGYQGVPTKPETHDDGAPIQTTPVTAADIARLTVPFTNPPGAGVIGAGAERGASTNVTPPNGTPQNSPFVEMVKTNPQGALKVVDDILLKKPGDARLLALRGTLKESTGDHRGAVADAKAALALDPANPLARSVVGYGDEAAHAQSKAAGLMKGGFEPKAEGLEAGGRGAGDRMGGLGGPGGGRGAGSGTGFQAGAAALAGTARASGSAGSVGGAAGTAGAGVAMTYQSPFAKKLTGGWRAFRIGDHKGAIDEASAILAVSPGDGDARTLRAAAYNRIGRPEMAIIDADEALKIKPNNVVALLERGYAKYQLGRYSDALTDVESALQLEPLNAMGHLYRGMILEKLDRVSDSIASYLRAGELDTSLKPLSEDAVTRLKGGTAPAAPSRSSLPSHGRLALYGGLALLALALLFKGFKRTIHPNLATPMTPLR